MHVGYCKLYRSCFRTFGATVLGIFVFMIRHFQPATELNWIDLNRNESSWNVRSRGTKVPRERMFHGTKVLGTFAPEERKFQGANVPWNESSTGAKVLSMVFSLPGTKVQRNEKAWNRSQWIAVAMHSRILFRNFVRCLSVRPSHAPLCRFVRYSQ